MWNGWNWPYYYVKFHKGNKIYFKCLLESPKTAVTFQKIWKWKHILKMKEYFENESVFWTPISKCCWLETKSRNQKDIWNCWPCFSPTPFFCQTVNPISTKGAWTPNLMFWKWKHILKMLLAASPYTSQACPLMM